MSERVLTLTEMSSGYDNTAVVRDVNLHVDRGEVVALLGPNGAGKTTTLGTISGIVKLMGGAVEVLGHSVPKLRKAHQVAQWGVAHVPEKRGLFFQLTVDENLKLAPGLTGPTDKAYDLFPALKPLKSQLAGTMSGGEQQMLALGRGLLADPSLLMVDEMSLGLAPVIYEKLMPMVRQVADETNAGVLLVEQHTDLALAQSDRAYVLSHGDMVLEGAASDLLRNRHLIDAAYMGVEELDSEKEIDCPHCGKAVSASATHCAFCDLEIP
jgi:branched-chain amino acid transport system ATP-binding protein